MYNDHEGSLTTMVTNKMKYLGIWRGANQDQNHMLANISIFITLVTCIAQAVQLLSFREDMQGAIDCFSVLIFTFVGLLKVTSLRMSRTKWQKLLTLVNDLEQLQKEEITQSDVEYETDDEVEKLDDKIYTKKIQSVGSRVSYVYWMSTVITSMVPIVEFALKRLRNLPASYPHTQPGWIPFGDNIKAYPFTILLEFIVKVYCVSGHIVFDTTSIWLMLFISEQFSTLRIKVQRIGGKGKSCFLSEIRNLRAHQRIIKCYQHHMTLIKVNRILDSILKPLMGVYINIVTVTQCATAIQLATDLSKLQKFSLIQVMFALSSQLFIFCHFGDSVLHASDMGPAEGSFSTSWWCLDTRTRKELLILGFGLSRPLHLNAGWFHSLNRPLFMSLLQTTYSFYTVFSQKGQD